MADIHLMADTNVKELFDALHRRTTWSTTTTTTYKPAERQKSLIRCDYCDMSYDGDEHENCPHCMAPRPRARPRPAVETQDSAVFYRDNVAYFTVNDEI